MTDPLEHKALVHFGRILMESVRDWEISEWDRRLTGAIPSTDPNVHEAFEKLSPNGKDFVRWLIPALIDGTLHKMMFVLEQGDVKGITVSVTTEDGETFSDLSQISDGLTGDLIYWTEAYSTERRDSAERGSI